MNLHPRLSRTARLVLIGGLATGAGFGAMAAVNAATSPSPPASATPGTGSGAAPHRDGSHHRGMPGLASGGTITSINGTTLTLRTENGTETVTTSGSTTFSKERRTIHLSDLQVGDVVHVLAQGAPPATTPGTGTVAATRVIVVEPQLGGRVTSIDGDTVHVTGRDGRLFTVTLTGSTLYYTAPNTSAQRSALTVGSHIMAEGPQDSLTHLTADDVVILPAGTPPRGPHGHAGVPGAPGGPGGPGGADFPGPPDGGDAA